MSSKRFISITTSIAAVPCFAWTNKAQEKNKDQLLLVHVLHRHGDRTPWYAIRNYNTSKQTWVPTISKLYSSYDENTLEPLLDNPTEIHSWKNISSKLRGISLAFKHDNWKKFSTTVFHSTEQSDSDQLCALSTRDDKEYPFLGQLTDKGCRELERVGKLLRERYIDTMEYLPSEYDANTTNLHYHSTNLSRTIQSADCVLHELYPMDERKDNTLIPLHIDIDLTYLSPSRMKFVFCDKLKKKAKDNELSILNVLDADDRFHELTNMVLKYYNALDNEWKYSNHGIAFDGMCCRLNHDIKDVPETFTDKCLYDFGRYLVRIQCAGMGLDRETLRLTWGNVLNKMMESMKSINEGSKDNGHMIISSCHDDSLLAMLSCIYGDEIHSADLEWPPYGSYIIFELWKDGRNGNKYVRVLYNGEPLNIFDGKDCIDLDILEQKWKDIMIDESSYFTGACIC